jgi:hypothetical protein
LLEDTYEISKLSEVLKAMQEGRIVVDGEDVVLNQPPTFHDWILLPSKNEYSDLPGYLYQSSYGGAQVSFGSLSIDPLVDYSLPSYPNALEAMRQWIGLAEFYYQSDARIGCVLIFMPECRARFESIVRSGAVLSVRTKQTSDLRLELRVSGGWKRPRGYTSISLPISDSSVELEIPYEALGVDLWIVGPRGNVFDYHREEKLWSLGQERILRPRLEEPADSTEALRQSLLYGEGEGIEFKPFVEIGSAKMREVIRTVVAFANTRGGSILLGVHDDCSVTGIERQLSKNTHGLGQPLDDACRQYEGALRQTINGALNRTLPLETVRAEFEGHVVLTIRVPEGDSKPYYELQTKQIFIRRGANNVHPDPDAELPALLDTKSGRSLWFERV